MNMTSVKLSNRVLRKAGGVVTLVAFLLNSVLPAYAQNVLSLPQPGTMVKLSEGFAPAVLKAVKIHTDNPFKFDFIVDTGDSGLEGDELKKESTRLIKYFLASLTTPENDFWVNLSPYEKDKIIPESFGKTEMGRDLLAQDYILKQLTASLIYPEDDLGREFWNKVYAQAQAQFGTTDIPVDTFNKVWIVPEKAVVYENGITAYVGETKLKVMLEQDYLALAQGTPGHQDTRTPPSGTSPVSGNSLVSQSSDHSQGVPVSQFAASMQGVPGSHDVNALGSQIIRTIIIPALEKEVNEGKNFATLRQVYHSLVLANWYKKRLKDSILAKIYMDKGKVKGVEYDSSVIASAAEGGAKQSPANDDIEKIYQRYVEAFKKGVYNYIREDIDPATQEVIPRKYFSGGAMLTRLAAIEEFRPKDQIPVEEMSPDHKKAVGVVLVDERTLAPLATALSDASKLVDQGSEESTGISVKRAQFLQNLAQKRSREFIDYFQSMTEYSSDFAAMRFLLQDSYMRDFVAPIKEISSRAEENFYSKNFIEQLQKDWSSELRAGTGKTFEELFGPLMYLLAINVNEYVDTVDIDQVRLRQQSFKNVLRYAPPRERLMGLYLMLVEGLLHLRSAGPHIDQDKNKNTLLFDEEMIFGSEKHLGHFEEFFDVFFELLSSGAISLEDEVSLVDRSGETVRLHLQDMVSWTLVLALDPTIHNFKYILEQNPHLTAGKKIISFLNGRSHEEFMLSTMRQVFGRNLKWQNKLENMLIQAFSLSDDDWVDKGFYSPFRIYGRAGLAAWLNHEYDHYKPGNIFAFLMHDTQLSEDAGYGGGLNTNPALIEFDGNLRGIYQEVWGKDLKDIFPDFSKFLRIQSEMSVFKPTTQNDVSVSQTENTQVVATSGVSSPAVLPEAKALAIADEARRNPGLFATQLDVLRSTRLELNQHSRLISLDIRSFLRRGKGGNGYVSSRRERLEKIRLAITNLGVLEGLHQIAAVLPGLETDENGEYKFIEYVRMRGGLVNFELNGTIGIIRLEKDADGNDVMVIIHKVFDGFNHAGRDRYAVYAASESKARHEFAELTVIRKFALDNGIDVSEKLGTNIFNWANDKNISPDERLARQNALRQLDHDAHQAGLKAEADYEGRKHSIDATKIQPATEVVENFDWTISGEGDERTSDEFLEPKEDDSVEWKDLHQVLTNALADPVIQANPAFLKAMQAAQRAFMDGIYVTKKEDVFGLSFRAEVAPGQMENFIGFNYDLIQKLLARAATNDLYKVLAYGIFLKEGAALLGFETNPQYQEEVERLEKQESLSGDDLKKLIAMKTETEAAAYRLFMQYIIAQSGDVNRALQNFNDLFNAREDDFSFKKSLMTLKIFLESLSVKDDRNPDFPLKIVTFAHTVYKNLRSDVLRRQLDGILEQEGSPQAAQKISIQFLLKNREAWQPFSFLVDPQYVGRIDADTSASSSTGAAADKAMQAEGIALDRIVNILKNNQFGQRLNIDGDFDVVLPVNNELYDGDFRTALAELIQNGLDRQKRKGSVRLARYEDQKYVGVEISNEGEIDYEAIRAKLLEKGGHREQILRMGNDELLWSGTSTKTEEEKRRGEVYGGEAQGLILAKELIEKRGKGRLVIKSGNGRTSAYVLFEKPTEVSEKSTAGAGVEEVTEAQIKQLDATRALTLEEIENFSREFPQWNWAMAAQVPWREVIHDPGDQSQPETLNQLNLWRNQISVRRVFLQAFKKFLDGQFNDEDFGEVLKEMNVTLNLGATRSNYYFSSTNGATFNTIDELKEASGKTRIADFNSRAAAISKRLRSIILNKDMISFDDVVLDFASLYRFFMGRYLFEAGNNSLGMNMVNGLLRLEGFNGISHHHLDTKYKEEFFSRVSSPQFLDEFVKLVRAGNGALNSTGAGAMSADSITPGGIDLNADKLNVDIRGKGQAINFDIDPQKLEELEFDGLTPTIITITPVTNLPLFLSGVSEEPSSATQLSMAR